jgi:predicted lipid carrier protein YhbT
MKADATTRFFEGLARRGHEPLLRKASGCTRFDVVDGRRVRRWFVDVDDGDVTVADTGEADCVIRADRQVFERLATGRLNPVAAVLRGDLEVEGDWRQLVRMQRLFPSPPRRRPRR